MVKSSTSASPSTLRRSRHRLPDRDRGFGSGFLDQRFVEELPGREAGLVGGLPGVAGDMRALALLDFPGVVFPAIHLDEFPRPPQAEVVFVVVRLKRRADESRRGAQWMDKRAAGEFFPAYGRGEGTPLPGEERLALARHLDPARGFLRGPRRVSRR
jgi:hypothetical protein